LQDFPWLAYLLQQNGGYCINCVLFCISGYRGSASGVLVTKPWKSFHKALEILRKNPCTSHHKESVIRCEGFVKVMSHQQPAISTVLNQQRADQIALNRRKLSSLFKLRGAIVCKLLEIRTSICYTSVTESLRNYLYRHNCNIHNMPQGVTLQSDVLHHRALTSHSGLLIYQGDFVMLNTKEVLQLI
uniref:Uncharacterized protein n=1 Tax=Amphimedon queenslandica TaxID=400682 RepID=A0A1X7U134_AMPQE